MKNRGFTLLEMMLAVALVGVATLGTINILSYFKLQYNRNFLLSDARLSSTLGERFLYIHLKNGSPSFNNLSVPDDNGKNFYDLNTDFPARVLEPDDRKRILTLSPGGRTSTYILTSEAKFGPPLYIDPVRLFSVTTATAGAAGSLMFVGLDNGHYITHLANNTPGPDGKTKISRAVWSQGNILYLYTPATLRPLSDPDKEFVAPYCFFGMVQGSVLIPQTFGGLVNCANPMDNKPVGDLQDFMLRLPSQAGGVPMILLRVVSVLRYDISPSATKGHYDLTFSTWDGTDFKNRQIAATNIQKVIFQRESVADTIVSVQVIPEDVKKK